MSAAIDQPGQIHQLRKSDLQPFPVFTPAEWQGKPVPEPNWLIDGIASAGNVAMLSSDGGLGKTMLLMQLMTAAALGNDWLGFKTQPLRSFGLFCEDPKPVLQARQARINRYYGCEMADLAEEVTMASRIDFDSYLCFFERFSDKIQMTKVWDQLQKAVLDCGAQIVILDTARRVFGGNEINEKQVSAFVTELRRFAMRIDGCIILTSHPSNEGISSGSGLAGTRAWHNDVRSRIYLTAEKKRNDNDRDFLIFNPMKSNYGPKKAKIKLVWEKGVLSPYQEPTQRSWIEQDPTF